MFFCCLFFSFAAIYMNSQDKKKSSLSFSVYVAADEVLESVVILAAQSNLHNNI